MKILSGLKAKASFYKDLRFLFTKYRNAAMKTVNTNASSTSLQDIIIMKNTVKITEKLSPTSVIILSIRYKTP